MREEIMKKPTEEQKQELVNRLIASARDFLKTYLDLYAFKQSSFTQVALEMLEAQQTVQMVEAAETMEDIWYALNGHVDAYKRRVMREVFRLDMNEIAILAGTEVLRNIDIAKERADAHA
jgi:hypothetical protein